MKRAFDDDDFDEDASSQSSKNGNPPVQRNAANARERARMRVLSSAFGMLKTKLPNIPPDTKLSKLDTLRLATMYIKQLKTLVESGNGPVVAGGAAIGSVGSSELDACGNGLCANNDNMLTGFEMDESGGTIFSLQPAASGMTWPFSFHTHSHHTTVTAHSTSRQLQFQYNTMDWSPNGSASSQPHQHHQQQQQQHQQQQQQQQQHGHSEEPHLNSSNSSSCSRSSSGSSSASHNHHNSFRQTTYGQHNMNPWCGMPAAHTTAGAATTAASCTYAQGSGLDVAANRLQYAEAGEHH